MKNWKEVGTVSDIRYIADKLYESNDEYISKRDAYLAVNAVVTGCESKETMEALSTVLVNIHHVPLADVAPVVRAHWKNVKRVLNSEWGECSNCDRANEFTRYCPYCGAKMDESEEK